MVLFTHATSQAWSSSSNTERSTFVSCLNPAPLYTVKPLGIAAAELGSHRAMPGAAGEMMSKLTPATAFGTFSSDCRRMYSSVNCSGFSTMLMMGTTNSKKLFTPSPSAARRSALIHTTVPPAIVAATDSAANRAPYFMQMTTTAGI